MPDKLWKATERRVAKQLGGKRVPVSGRQRGDSPDVEHEDFSIEVKSWYNIPDWLYDAVDQAKKSATGDKIPLVVLHKKGMKTNTDLAIFEMSGIMKLYQEILELREKNEELNGIVQDSLVYFNRVLSEEK